MLSPETDALARLLARCGHFVHHQTHRGGQQDAVIALLGENGPMSQRDLQQRLGIQPGSVSELVAKLAAKDLVCRERDPRDRRRMVLRLTDKGTAHLRLLTPRPMETLFAPLSGEERAQLLALLEKLSAGWAK